MPSIKTLNRRRFGMGQSPISSSAVTTIEDENGNTSGVPFVIFKGLKRTTNKRKTMRVSKGLTESTKSQMVEIFLGMLNTVKLYHWKTYSFAEHKATDELYASLNDHIDEFVEVALGKDESRLKSIRKSVAAFNDSRKIDFKARVYQYRNFLISMNDTLDNRRDTDLLNIRDEILGDINKFLYLLTFNK